jgi:sugar/nucleoside kinase (ribokinase family)
VPVVLAAIGDVVDDIVVHVGGPIRVATDTPSSIARRRGGSAANVAAAAARLVGRARFLGQVGDDGTADLVLAELVADGVDVSFVRRAGRTGSIVVLVDEQGERSFLTDAGSARALDDPDPAWLDGVDVLHVPVYSLVDEPIASTAITTVGWAHARGIAVSIDASSVAVLEAYGVEPMLLLLAELRPTVVFANGDEAELLGIAGPLGDAVTYVKCGARDATVHVPGVGHRSVPAFDIGSVADTTGAGDAFAAGVLIDPIWRTDPVAACVAGHRSAAALLSSRRHPGAR